MVTKGTSVRLAVDRAAGCDEGGHVGDRVVDAVSAADPLQVQGLVEVAGPRRVDGDEGDVRAVEVRQSRAPCCLLGLREHVVGKA